MSEIFPETLDFWETPSGNRACIMKTSKRLFGGRKYDLVINLGNCFYAEQTITDTQFDKQAYKYIGHWDIKNLFEVRIKR